MSNSGFRKYEKVGKLGTQETDGLLDGLVYVMPKLDGTNASIWLDLEGNVRAGSRNRTLAIGNDNAGFCSHVKTSGNYKEFLEKYPKRTLYGEWLVPHSVKDYKDTAWRFFYVFDVWDADEQRYLEPHEYEEDLYRFGIRMVPYLTLSDPSSKGIEEALKHFSTFLMKEGKVGEGIVLKNYSFINKFGEVKYAKYLNEGFVNNIGTKRASDNPVEQELAERCVSEHLVSKTVAKLELLGLERKVLIPRLLDTVWHDVLTEELPNALKKMKYPTVNTGKLRGLCFQLTKKLASQYF